ncbi:Cmx/CmrA family chloramphenicol efflux MFS transporter [Saccharothrix sp. HUAS TT1]|uniref:Cmx/CmrA family chloramphenicol efflux MFS transporter n=1 Tax=unclassified Saccharothrix TaxID=2593673 RepID=UPI00345BEFD0
MPFFVHVLGLAVFAQGTSEFMVSGLVPGIADDLSVSTAAAASLTSAYALGMVVGAPAMAALSARWPRRRALAAFLSAFVVVHAVGAVATDFALLFGTRVVAAIVNAGFLAVAMSAAVALAPPEKQGRANAVLLSGVTLACVVGVPAGASLGGWAGWRSVFWAVAALCLPALALVFRSAPATAAGRPEVSIRREAGVLRSRPVRRVVVLAALVNGATFATYGYLGVIADGVLPGGAAPALLAAFGVGAFVGVTVAGRVTGERFLVLGLCALPVGWAALALAADHAALLFGLAVVQGALSFGVGSTLIGRVVRLASDAPSLGGAFATVALNVGAFAGPLVVGATTDHRGAPWVSAVLAAVAVSGVRRPGSSRSRHVPR